MITSLSALEIISQYSKGSSLIEEKAWELENVGVIEPDLQIEENFPEPYQDFTYKIETENLQNEDSGINRVTLSVNWQTKKGKREISLVTYLVNKENE